VGWLEREKIATRVTLYLSANQGQPDAN